ncbi:MAG: YihA family ribosome biogenesis GTP-binding protein [bacterium]|nr:YihA family ribosome biogenesis GTP-binding protein [bacterium]
MKIATAEFVLSAKSPGQLLRSALPEIAFAGRSNVGKSSVMNRLLNRKALARTSGTPGRTQAVNYFLIDRRFHFVDLPGYGFAKAARSARRQWAALMDDYLGRATVDSPARGGPRVLVVQLIDGKVGATELDLQAHHYLGSLGLEPLVVATKIDKVPRSRRPRALREIRQRLELPEDDELVAFSAISGEGIKPLWKGISAFLAAGAEKPPEKRG